MKIKTIKGPGDAGNRMRIPIDMIPYWMLIVENKDEIRESVNRTIQPQMNFFKFFQRFAVARAIPLQFVLHEQ